MCEAFEALLNKYADQICADREVQVKTDAIRHIMDYMKCSMEEAFDALEIEGDERTIIAERIQAT